MTIFLRPLLGTAVLVVVLAGCAPTAGAASDPGDSHPVASAGAAPSSGTPLISSLAHIGGTAWQTKVDPVNHQGWLFGADGMMATLLDGRAVNRVGALPTDKWAVTGNTVTWAFTQYAADPKNVIKGKGEWDANSKTLTVVLTDGIGRSSTPFVYEQVQQVFP